MTETFIVVQQPGPQGPAGSGAVALTWYNVKDYGALGDGSNDDTAAIQSAITAIPATGGKLFFPAGSFKCTGTLDFSNRRNIIVQGVGGTSGGATTASLLWTSQTGSGTFLNVKGTAGVLFEDMQIAYSSASFTGRVIDYRIGSGDAAYGGTKNCLVTGLSGVATARLVDTDQAIFLTFTNSVFGGADIAIYGKATNGSFSNGIRMIGCTFNSCTTVALRNPGNWQIIACGFEGTGASAAKALDHDTGVFCRGLLVQGCWSGDTTGGTTFKVAGKAIVIAGNYIGASSGTGVSVDGNSSGVNISYNEFDGCTTAVNVSSGTHEPFVVVNNTYTSVTTKLVGYANLPAGSWYQDTDRASPIFKSLYIDGGLDVTGDITLSAGSDFVVDTATGTRVGTATTQKLGFWNATPVIQATGWGTPTGTATRTTYVTGTATIEEVAERLKGLIDDLKTYGILGA